MAPRSNEKSLNVKNILRLKGHEKHRERGKIKVISLLRRDVPESRTKKKREKDEEFGGRMRATLRSSAGWSRVLSKAEVEKL